MLHLVSFDFKQRLKNLLLQFLATPTILKQASTIRNNNLHKLNLTYVEEFRGTR
jgi:TnpA family transposase